MEQEVEGDESYFEQQVTVEVLNDPCFEVVYSANYLLPWTCDNLLKEINYSLVVIHEFVQSSNYSASPKP